MPQVLINNNYWKLNIPQIAKHYGATYVGDFPIPTPFPDGDEFQDYPAAVFWRPEKHRSVNQPEYFGIINPNGKPLQFTVFNAGYVTGFIFNGLEFDNTIIYSNFETHKPELSNGASITGGWSYCAVEPENAGKPCRLQVVNNKITVLED